MSVFLSLGWVFMASRRKHYCFLEELDVAVVGELVTLEPSYKLLLALEVELLLGGECLVGGSTLLKMK